MRSGAARRGADDRSQFDDQSDDQVAGPYVLRADGDVDLTVHVVPGAARTQLAGLHGAALKVRVAAPPERGRANDAVIDLLADALGLPRSAIRLTSGATSRTKRFRLTAPDLARLAALVRPSLNGPRDGSTAGDGGGA